MKKAVSDGDGYTLEELRGIWRRFRSRRNAAEILSGFALVSEDQARLLIREFRGEPSPEPEDHPQFPPAPHGPQDFEF